MKLNEIFNSKVEIKKVYSKKRICTFNFTIKENTYEFDALDEREMGEKDYPDSDPRAGKIWDVSFTLKGGDEDEPYHKTGTGNAFAVFAAFTECVKKFIELYPKVEEIYFEGDMSESSRIKLYDRPNFIKIPGWTYSQGKEEHDEYGHLKKYHLIKNKP